MNWIELSGPEILELVALVVEAFDRHSFESLLLALKRNTNELPTTGVLEDDVRKLIEKDNREGRVLPLVVEIKKKRPNRPDIQAFGPAFDVDIAGGLPETSGLETILELANHPLDAGVWVKDLQTAMSRVCRIEMNGRAYGTGFLVGPRAVLTCFHVLRKSIGDSDDLPEEAPSGLAVRFDFQAAGGQDAGTVCGLDGADWLIAHRPPGPDDRGDSPAPERRGFSKAGVSHARQGFIGSLPVQGAS